MKFIEFIAHVIFIGARPDEKLKKKIISKGFKNKDEIREEIMEHFPEIDAFLRIFNQEKQKNFDKFDIKLYLFYGNIHASYKELINNFLKTKEFRFQEVILDFNINNKEEINENVQKLEDLFLEISNEHDNIFFNVTSANLDLIKIVLELTPEIDGQIYLLTSEKNLVFLPVNISPIIKKSELTNYEALLLDSFKFSELNEIGMVNYEIDLEIIPNLLRNTKKISDEEIIIEKKGRKQKFYDIIKMIKINGIKFSRDEKIETNKFFFHKIFEGLSYFKNVIFRLIINDENGIILYLGVINSGNNVSELLNSIDTRMENFIKLLKATFPNIEMESVKTNDLKKILEFIRTKQYFGGIVGYPGSVSNFVLKELENALSQEKWGMMSIAESLGDIPFRKLIKDLRTEMDSILENFPLSMDEFKKQLKDSKNLKELGQKLNVSYFRLMYLSDLYKVMDYFQRKKIIGLWDTCSYIFTDNENTYNTIYSIVKSNYKNPEPFWFPLKIIVLDNLLSQFPKNFQLISIERQSPTISNELKLFHTIYSSHRLGSFIFLPLKPLTNFDITEVPTFQSQFPLKIRNSFKNPIRIGILKNTLKVEEFFVDLNSLSRHCIVMGSTGSGKTNTIFNIILKIREINENFPFLIIDPAKKEYRHLKSIIKDLNVYTTGKEVNPLKINLFEVPPFLTFGQWLNELLEIISSAFYMYSPLREMILTCLFEIYKVNGWTEEKRGRTPTLEEFISFSKLRIDCSDYDSRTKDAWKGAFETRVETLIKGTRAQTFNVHKSNPSFEDLRNKPTVIELSGLMNDEEKALVFNLILRKLYLYAQYLGFSSNLRHITIIEEAHRLITGGTTPEHGRKSIQTESQELFSDILSEIRTYGEGFIIAEQKPKQLTNAALTNTNLKICHKLPSLEQIRSFEDSLGLLKEHVPFITRLKPGECIIKIDEVDSPFFIQCDLIKEELWGIEKEITDDYLKNISKKIPLLKKINYKVGRKIEKNSFYVEISELKYQIDGEEKVILNPNKDQCIQFLNFEDLFWKEMKNFYSKYSYCPKCERVTPVLYRKPNCQQCNTLLEKMNELEISQFDDSIKKNVIIKTIKLEALYERHKILAPSEHSRSSQAGLQAIKKEFWNILEDK